MTSTLHWQEPSETLALAANEVHVWRVDLDALAAQAECLTALLSDEEVARATRFRFEHDRRRYTVAHAALRAILSGYLATDPWRLEFRAGTHGKPEMAKPQAMYFNLSHSGSLAIVAVTRIGEVGVDVEQHRPLLDADDIAERYFSLRERASLRRLPEELKQQAFFDGWARKEAYIKARGLGLALALDGFDVSLTPGQPAELQATGDEPSHARRWKLRELPAGDGYSAAVCVDGRGWKLCGFQWREPVSRRPDPVSRMALLAA